MRFKGALLLLVMLLSLAVAMTSFAEDEDAADPAPLPQDIYPNADVIITKDSKDNTLVTFRAYGDYKVTKDHPSEWFTITYPSNTDVTIRNLSMVDSKLNIVFDGASVKKLILFSVDTKAALNAAVNVNFHMYSGEIQTLSLMSIPRSISQYLGTSYDSMSSPLHTVTLNLHKGSIDLLNPTAYMVSITNYHLNIFNDMTINKLYTTGENGKYSNLYVNMNGSHIGYMTNIASKVGTIRYDIQSGIIDYFCLGANTEHVSSKKLANMSTFYVSGDVKIHLSDYLTVKKCIMGAGILNIPNLLRNGEIVSDSVIHMVTIDAPDLTIYNDSSFFTERRTSAYHFNNYKIGQNPYAYSLMDTFDYNGTDVKVYSENGVWDSKSSCTIPVGGLLSINTELFVQYDGRFTVEKGATVYNSNNVVLSGYLIVEGTFINNSVIQCRLGSSVTGDISGIGYLAEYKNDPITTSTLDVKTDRTAVVIALPDELSIETISATFTNDNRSVTIAIDNIECIIDNELLISLHEVDPPEDFERTFRLDVKGIDISDSEKCKLSVTLPTNNNVCTDVYAFDYITNEYEVIGSSEFDTKVTFPSDDYNQFFLLTYIDDRPNPNPEPVDEKTGMTNLDYFLIAAIIAVLCVTVYAIVTMKRD